MANAMEILGDHEIIYEVFKGNLLKHYEGENHYDWYIKEYINKAYLQAQKYHDDYEITYKQLYEEYRVKRDKWYKHGMNGPSPVFVSSHYLGDSIDYVRLKVNHYRQKFWYWKKLIE